MSQSWLITGGSSGLGLSLGRAVLKKGGVAVLTTRSVTKAQQAAPDIERDGGKWLQLDYSMPNLEQTVKDAVSKWNIDVLVNNAGFACVGAVEDFSLETMHSVYDGNFFGPLRVAQAVLPIFRERNAGTITNVGSSVSHLPMAANAMYASSKAALRIATEGLAAEVASFGIRVLLFEPGRFRTNFGTNAKFAAPDIGFSEPYRGSQVERIITYLQKPGQAPGDPDKAAQRIYDVISRTGPGADEKVKDRTTFLLGPDAYGLLAKTAKDMAEAAEVTKDISTSTNFEE